MPKPNTLATSPPYEVENTLVRLGAQLRTARLRRNLTIAQVAERIGAGARAVADAEKGKPTTAIVTYAALLWTYGLLDDMRLLADPGRDEEGLSLARVGERERARSGGGLDNDF